MTNGRVLFIAPYHGLAEVAKKVAREFPDLSVTIHEGDLSEGLAAAITSIDSDYDVVISRGGTAQMLEDEIAVPVLEVGISTMDLQRALIENNPAGKSCAVVGFSNAINPLSQFVDFADFDLRLFEVNFEDELPLATQRVLSGGYESVLCDTFSLEAFKKLGIDAHLLSSGPESVAEVFEGAELFCRHTEDLRTRNRMLWQMIGSQGSKFAIFQTSGRLTYSNLTESKTDLLAFMREHLEPMSGRLTFRRGHRRYTLRREVIGNDVEKSSISFAVTASTAPSNNSLVGISYSNHDEVERSYRTSVFHIVGADEDMAEQISKLVETSLPLMLEGEVGSGKKQIAELVYLSGGWKAKPFVMIDCPLLIDRSWSYLTNSSHSPLFGSGCTIYLKSAYSLGEERFRSLVDIIKSTRLCDRNHLIVSANDNSAAQSWQSLRLISESVRGTLLSAPPVRALPNIRQAITRLVEARAKEYGRPTPVLSDQAMSMLSTHRWDRNYLELNRVVQRMLTRNSESYIEADDVRWSFAREKATQYSSTAPDESNALDLMRPIKDIERDVVRTVVGRCSGNQTEAAKILGLSRTTVWRLLKS